MSVAALSENPPAIFDVRPTLGASNLARSIEEKLRDGLGHLKQSVSLNPGLSGAYAELAEIEEECLISGWDGYDALPVHPLSVEYARQFLGALPLGLQAPSIGADPDGHVTLEWCRSPNRILSISISPEGLLHYASLFGSSKQYGSEPFSGSIPESVLELVIKILG